MPPGPALAHALCATSLDVLRAASGYDAVVIGAGAAGGLAALLLTEAGFRVLVLDAGLPPSPVRTFVRRLSHGAARRLLGASGPKVLDRLLSSPISRNMIARRQPVQSLCYAWALAPWQFVDDIDCPYVTPPDRPFVWLRSRQLGGRVVIPGHGRQYYRLGPYELSPADELSPPWPLQAGELDPWYAMVERRLALAGRRDNLPWLPDSEISTVLEPTPTEAALQASVSARWPGAHAVIARFAPPLDALEAAAQTGRLSIRRGAIVREIEVDGSGCVRGVVWIDQQSRTEERVCAPLVFLCASALESTRLLLLSRSPRSPDGLGAASGVLGRCLMDHIRMRVAGDGPPFTWAAFRGRALPYIPRFDARDLPAPGPGRGFGVQVFQQSAGAEHSRFTPILSPKCSHGRRTGSRLIPSGGMPGVFLR